MTVHIQKINKAAPRLLTLVFLCCLFCVSLPAASAESPDTGVTDGRFLFNFSPTNGNLSWVKYPGAQYISYEVTQTGEFSDDSSLCPYVNGYLFKPTGAGTVSVHRPTVMLTVPISGGPVRTSDNAYIAFEIEEVLNGTTTKTRYEVTEEPSRIKDEGLYRTYTISYGSFAFKVDPDALYRIRFIPLFEFNSDSEVGSTLTVKTLGPAHFTTVGPTFYLRNYNNVASIADVYASTYDVTVTGDEGCTVAPFRCFFFPVEDGVTYYFTVDIADSYRKTDDFSVTVNGAVASPITSGVYKDAYRVLNPSGPQTIEVTGVEKAFYTVTLSDEVEGCRLVPYGDSSLPVPYGADFTFKIEVDDDYLKTASFGVYANGVWVAESGGSKTCTIYNVTADQIITVKGVEKRPEYYITFSEGEGYLINPRFTSPVDGTAFYRFSVEILDGYRKSDSFMVRANGEPLEAESGDVYGFRARGDIHFTIEGVERIPRSYPVTFLDSGGYTVVPVAGSSFTVEEGGMFRFMVQIETGYRKTADFAVSANGMILTAVNGEYRIDNITSPQEISVSGVIAIPGVDPGHKPDYNFDTDTTDFVYATISLFDRVVDAALSFPVLLFFGSVAAVLICFAIFQRLYSNGKRRRLH